MLTWLLFSFKVTFYKDYPEQWTPLLNLLNHRLIYFNYQIATTLLICISFMFLSYILRRSSLLLDLGKNTMILMCMEFMAKNFIALNVLHIFTGNLPRIGSELQTICFFITIIFVRIFFKPLNKHIPYLIGK